MIDFIKTDISHVPESALLDNPDLKFKGIYDRSTGEVDEYPLFAKYGPLLIVLKSINYRELSGSIHKFSNWILCDDRHNHNDFNISNLIDAILLLTQNLHINPFLAPLRSLEFGVNIHSPIDTITLIRDHIIRYGGKNVSYPKNYEKKGYMRKFELQRFIVKIYAKSRQYQLDSNLLRIEYKSRKMRDLNDIGIIYLSDLLITDNLINLRDKLLKVFSRICIVDVIEPPESMDEKSEEIYVLCTDARKLRDLQPNPKDYPDKSSDRKYKSDYACYSRMIYKFEKLIHTHKLDTIKTTLSENIRTKWGELMILSNSDREKLTNLSEMLFIGNMSETNPLYIGLLSSSTCKITGEDISDQRKGSKFLSEKKIGYKEAHRLRNLDSNPRNNFRRKIERVNRHPTLFDANDFLRQLTNEEISHIEYFKQIYAGIW